jgi:hypothetical protein
VSRRSVLKESLLEQFDNFDFNFNRELKKVSKNKSKLKEARRERSKNYKRRRNGHYSFKGKRP